MGKTFYTIEFMPLNIDLQHINCSAIKIFEKLCDGGCIYLVTV